MRKTISVLLVIAVFAVSALAVGFTPRDAVKTTEDTAKSLVLQDAGEKATDVIFTRVELSQAAYAEKTSGYEYSICFNSDEADYEYELDASTGKLLSRCVTLYNFDVITPEELAASRTASDNQAAAPSGEPSGNKTASAGAARQITEAEAKTAVLKEANLSEGDVTGLSVQKTNIGDKAAYQVSFGLENSSCVYSLLASDGTVAIAQVKTDLTAAEDKTEAGGKPAGTAPAQPGLNTQPSGNPPAGNAPAGGAAPSQPGSQTPANSVPTAGTASKNAAHGGKAGAISDADYQAYLKAWLLEENKVNDTMTDEQVNDEFIPMIEAGNYSGFPVDMLFNGMLETGTAMTYEQFVAANGVY